MVKLHFETTEEFEGLFKRKTKNVTDAIVVGIEKAMHDNRKTAMLFEITFAQAESMFEISLPRSQWATALEQCLKHYEQLNLTDECIDTWKLLEAAKVW